MQIAVLSEDREAVTEESTHSTNKDLFISSCVTRHYSWHGGGKGVTAETKMAQVSHLKKLPS